MPTDAAARRALGWGDDFDAAWKELKLGSPRSPVRVSRLDRGWSTTLAPGADDGAVGRVRNLGVDVAVGDWIVASADGERVEHVLGRQSAFVRRASFEGDRAESHTLAANVDTMFLCHSFGVAPNQRRLERELVLGFDSGADPVVVLTKADLVADPEPARPSCRRWRSGCRWWSRAGAGTPASGSCDRSSRQGRRWRSSARAAWASRRSSTR